MHTISAMLPQAPKALEDLIRTLLGFFAIPCEGLDVQAAGDDGRLLVSLTVPEGSMLIGKGGQNLKAFEHVVRMIWTRQHPEARGLVVDVNDYRKSVAAELASHARQIAGRVRETGRPEALRPMTSYERRIIHTELAAYADLASESVGQEPHRRVVIRPI
jgi:spoIIIJ-associated protein